VMKPLQSRLDTNEEIELDLDVVHLLETISVEQRKRLRPTALPKIFLQLVHCLFSSLL